MINNASKLKHWYSLSEYPSGKFSMHFHAHIEIYVLVCRFSFPNSYHALRIVLQLAWISQQCHGDLFVIF